MSIDARLNKLMPVLSARERAILILESWKRGEEEDPLWRRTMPPEQSTEFNRLIGLMNGSVLNLGSYVTYLEQQADKLELRQCWLVALVLWDEQLTEIDRAARRALREPITESEFAARQRELDEAWVPVTELAEVLAGDYTAWSEEDLEEMEDWDEPVVSDAAWERVVAEKEAELRRLVAAGVLQGRGKGTALTIQEGVFNAYFGHLTTPCPEDGLGYRVLPDSEHDAVEDERQRNANLQEAIDARRLVIKGEGSSTRVLDVLAGHLRSSLAAAYASLQQAVGATVQVVAESAAQFEGADPLKPEKREALDALVVRVHGLGEQLIFLGVELEVVEPDEDLIESLRRAASHR